MGSSRKLRLHQRGTKSPDSGAVKSSTESLPIERFIDSLSDPVLMLDDRGSIVHANPSVQKLTGYSGSELTGRSFREIFVKKSGSRLASRLSMAKGDDRKEPLAYSVRCKTGQPLTVIAVSGAVGVGDSTITVMTLRAETPVQERGVPSVTETNRLMDDSPLGYHALDEAGCLIDVNRTWLDSLGYRRNEVIGRSFADFLSDRHGQSFQENFPRLKERGHFSNVEVEMLKKNGTQLMASFECRAVYGDDGRFEHTQCVFHDISARKRIETMLSQSEQRYRTIVKDQTELVCRWTPDGTLTFVNDAYCRYFGKKSEELVGRSFMPLIPDSDHEEVESHFESFEPDAPVQTHQHRVLAADGEIHWQQWTNRAIFDPNGRIVEFQSVGSDITQLKLAEEALKYRLEIERLITSLSSKFISLEPDEIGSNIVEVIRAVGSFTRADRCYVFMVSDDRKTMDNTHEWCAAGIEPQIDELKNIPIEVFSYSLKRMADGEVFHVPRVADLPDEASAERAEFEREGIRSVICLPMARRGQLVGFLGLDSVKHEKVWSADEISLLKIVTEMVMTALERERADRALRISEEKYRSFVQNFQGIAFQSRMDWIPLFFHGAVEEITGYTEQDFISGNPRWDEIIHPEDWDVLEDSATKMATVPGYSTEREYRIVRKDGSVRWVHEQSQNTSDEHGQPLLVQGALYDITDRKAAAAALEKSEQRFRTMADFTYDWEYWLGTNGQCVYVSPSCESTTGYKASEFQQDFGILRRITHPDDLHVLDRHLNDEDEVARVTSIDFRITTRYGEERWINHVCQPVYTDDGTFLGKRASNRDITDRKHAEEALRRERDRAQRYLDVAGTVLLAINTDERVVMVNRKGCHILGRKEPEIIGSNWFNRYVPISHREEVRKTFRKLLSGRSDSSAYFEYPILNTRGEERLIAWYNTVVRDESGCTTGTLSSGSDITERKHMERVQSVLFDISEAANLAGSLEELLATIRKILGKLIDTTNFYVALYDDRKGVYTFPYLVDRYHKSADVAPEELRRSFTDYVRRTGKPLLADDKKDMELRSRGEVEVVGQPSKVWMGVPLETSQGVIGVVAVQSYTDASLYKESDLDLMTFVSRHICMAIERKLAEEALRQSEEHYRRLVETMNEGLVVRDNKNVITFANKKLCEMTGYAIEELVGMELSDFVDEENLKVLDRQLAARLCGSAESYELTVVCKDGSEMTAIVSPEPLRDASDAVVGSLSVITDISERKRAEDRLRQATELLRLERGALTQKNIALKEVLDHIEKERQDYKQSICRDVEQALEPFLVRLKMFAEESRARDIETLETQLDAILAKDIDVFRDRYSRLSPRELEVCDLIKANMSSKEISERLNLSLLTVHKHREQIRKKLGITSKGINLSTYLQSH
ncbi:MAG: PAS domain S-box protein [Candidatus Zixiibacteriota bacterium]|nr:MAG: PAS domain S-box protein [candidate division Zixibacteria bacterium]